MSEPMSEMDKEKRFIELYKKIEQSMDSMVGSGIQPIQEIANDEFLEYMTLRSYFSKEKLEDLIERARL